MFHSAKISASALLIAMFLSIASAPVIAQNPLDYTDSREVMAWAEAHPWAHVASFAAK